MSEQQRTMLWAWIGSHPDGGSVRYEVHGIHSLGRVWLVPYREWCGSVFLRSDVAKYDTEGRTWVEWPEIRFKAAHCLLEKLRDLQDERGVAA